MNTLIIYDETGYILSTRRGEPSPREPIGVPFIWIDIPEGKRIKITDGIGVDTSVTPHQVILEDIPPTETQVLNQALSETTMLIAQQQEQIETQNQAISELTILVAGGNE